MVQKLPPVINILARIKLEKSELDSFFFLILIEMTTLTQNVKLWSFLQGEP